MDLWDALELDSTATTPVVAVAGGGGKSSLMYRLGVEAEARGRRAVLGGTTRFTGPTPPFPAFPRVEAGDDALAEAVARALEEHSVVIAVPGHEPKSRFAAMSVEAANDIAALSSVDLLVVEADGSKLRPFKAPAEHEPVIPSSATHVCVVVGAGVLDAPLDEEHVHRPERVRAIAGDAEVVTPEVIAAVMASPRGGRRGVEARGYTVVVNQADTHLDAARRTASAVRAAGVGQVLVTSLRADDPVLDAG